MKSIIFTILFVLFTYVTCFANPFLTAAPMENNVKYYVLNIDDADEYIPADFDMNFLYELGLFKQDKDYICELRAGNDEGECPPIRFIINRKSNKNWIFFNIITLPEEITNDPAYNDRFIQDELSIKIHVSDVIETSSIAITGNQEFVNPEDMANGYVPVGKSSNSACFIETAK